MKIFIENLNGEKLIIEVDPDDTTKTICNNLKKTVIDANKDHLVFLRGEKKKHQNIENDEKLFVALKMKRYLSRNKKIQLVYVNTPDGETLAMVLEPFQLMSSNLNKCHEWTSEFESKNIVFSGDILPWRMSLKDSKVTEGTTILCAVNHKCLSSAGSQVIATSGLIMEYQAVPSIDIYIVVSNTGT
ncbi:unnamed protein product [Meganyctiphanes norvegica]|uniref:Ubiquitin-like domain-containing protein n=1 Tax=Meganyctiphanes norvegica TaxID=48144 RepID=A0AAV2SFJ2_MEGNR